MMNDLVTKIIGGNKFAFKERGTTSVFLFHIVVCLFFLSLAILSKELEATEVIAATDKTPQEPVLHAVNTPPMKGTFTQSKNIKPLKRPFNSSGIFVYLPNKGLLWHTQKPVDSIKLFANDGVYNVDKNGVLQKEANVDNDFFLALFAADEERLSKYFKTQAASSHKNQDTCLGLTPISSTLKSLFVRIHLCVSEVGLESDTGAGSGTKIPTQIELIEENTNNTTIQLQLSSGVISAEELAYFE